MGRVGFRVTFDDGLGPRSITDRDRRKSYPFAISWLFSVSLQSSIVVCPACGRQKLLREAWEEAGAPVGLRGSSRIPVGALDP